MKEFGFIRHARTQWNLEKKIQGRNDIALNDEGIRQAECWGKTLNASEYGIILSSPMERAHQTARIIADTILVDIEYDVDLREQDFGEWEGRKLIDIKNEAPGEIELQESLGWNFCPPLGESRIVVLKRALKAIEKAAKCLEEKKILMISHSSVMKILIYKAMERNFTLKEEPVLKDYHLHLLTLHEKLQIKKINHICLL